MKHSNDALSVDMTVNQLKKEQFNPILLYKRQGTIDAQYPTVSSDGFVLAIQTEFQLELYRKFAGKVLCIDSTHGTNCYRFKLVTCVVADEQGHGE